SSSLLNSTTTTIAVSVPMTTTSIAIATHSIGRDERPSSDGGGQGPSGPPAPRTLAAARDEDRAVRVVELVRLFDLVASVELDHVAAGLLDHHLRVHGGAAARLQQRALD